MKPRIQCGHPGIVQPRCPTEVNFEEVRMKSFVRLASLCVLALLPSLAFAQGTTGSLNGTVTTDGKALPGATITIASPSMQGTKTAVSGESGGYYFPGL